MTTTSTQTPTQTIRVTAGGQEFTWPATITENTGKDISGDTVQISLGTYGGPGAWQDGVLTRPTAASATIKLLVDNSVPVGSYYVWIKVTDFPEVVPRQAHRVTVI